MSDLFKKGYEDAKKQGVRPVFVRGGTGSSECESLPPRPVIEGNFYCMVINANGRCPTRTYPVFLSRKTENILLATGNAEAGNASMAFIGKVLETDSVERGILVFSDDAKASFMAGQAAYEAEVEAQRAERQRQDKEADDDYAYWKAGQRSKWSGAAGEH